MATFNHISGAEPSTITFKLATVTQTRNSSAMHQEILTIGDPDSSLALAAVLNAVPASTAWGVVVRQVGNSSIQGNSTVFQGTSPWVIAGNSTVAPLAGSTWATRPVQSSQADLRMTAYQSTAADLNVTIAGNSTVVQGTTPWTIAGNSTVIVQSGNSSVIVTSGNSSVIVTSGNLTSTCVQGTSPWVVAEIMQSSVAPSSNSSGVIVRQVIDALTTFASTTALASTVLSVVSSVANIRAYVTAFTLTSTNQTAAQWGFYSSNGTLLWPMIVAALSSAVAGMNLAVAPPGYLFRTAASDALNFKTNGATVAGVQLGVSYFQAP